MRSATLFLLIFVAILLATNAEPRKKIFRFPLKRASKTTNALSPRSTQGPAPVKYDTQAVFTVNVGVGTPPQPFDLVVDTGYPHIVIADDYCNNCGNPPRIARYNGGASSSYKDLGASYSALDGLLLGSWTSDNFQLPAFTVTRPFVRLTKVLNNWVSRGKYSGLLGLGLHNSGPYYTFLEFLSQQKTLDKNVISCRFLKDPQNPGEIVFGAIDQQHIDGDLTTIPVLNGPSDPQWIIPIEDLQINQRSLGGGTGYIDTGIEKIDLPFAVVEDLYTDTGAQYINGIWAVPDPFPHDVSFVLNDVLFTVPKEDVPLRQFPKFGDLYMGAFQVGDEKWALGLPLITNYYVVFDFTAGAENVGIAKRK